MTGAISAISNNSIGSVSSGSSSSALSEETKKKLEALGIDTSQIKTESEGLTKLKEAQASQAAAQAQGQPPAQQGVSSMQTIQEEAVALAGKVGVNIGSNDKLEDILNNISQKISTLQISAGQDEMKKSETQNLQSEYTAIYQEYVSAKSGQAMIGNGLNALANYNKIALGLS